MKGHLVLALLFSFTILTIAQNSWDYLPVQPIPPKPPGRSIGQLSAPIWIEAVFDLQCPDSKTAWAVNYFIFLILSSPDVRCIL